MGTRSFDMTLIKQKNPPLALEMSFPRYPQSRRFQTLSVRVAVIALVVTGLTAKAGGQSIPPVVGADWESYNNGVRGWRYNADEKTLTPQTAPQLVEKWRFPPAGSTAAVGVIHGTPAVVNGYVYFGTGSYPAVYKLKPNGQVAWVFRPGEGAIAELPKGGLNRIDAGVGFLASPLVTDKAVYVGNNAGVFYALDRLTGRELWKVDTRAPGFPNHYAANLFNASAILADGKIPVWLGRGGMVDGRIAEDAFQRAEEALREIQTYSLKYGSKRTQFCNR